MSVLAEAVRFVESCILRGANSFCIVQAGWFVLISLEKKILMTFKKKKKKLKATSEICGLHYEFCALPQGVVCMKSTVDVLATFVVVVSGKAYCDYHCIIYCIFS